jgi:hypothetical protein
MARPLPEATSRYDIEAAPKPEVFTAGSLPPAV